MQKHNTMTGTTTYLMVQLNGQSTGLVLRTTCPASLIGYINETAGNLVVSDDGLLFLKISLGKDAEDQKYYNLHFTPNTKFTRVDDYRLLFDLRKLGHAVNPDDKGGRPRFIKENCSLVVHTD